MDNSMDYVEIEERIASIVEHKPKDIGTDNKTILYALKRLPETRFFTKYAKDVAWLYWLDQQNALKKFFNPHCELTDAQTRLSDWIAECFVIDHSKHLFELLYKHGSTLNPVLWSSIVRILIKFMSRSTPKVLAMWVIVLLKDVPTITRLYQPVESLLLKCRPDEDKFVINQLLSYLLTPIPVSEYSTAYIFSKSKDFKYEYRLTLRGEEYYLRESWIKFKPHLGINWRTLLPTVQKYLTDAFQMNVHFDKAGGDEDIQSLWRSAIERHEQDENSHRSFDILIDAARDILEHTLSNDELVVEGKQLVESWFATEVPLLRRIAIHGIGLGDCWTPDEKIEWLLDRKLIHRHWFKHETFQVIKKAMPECKGSVVKKLIKVIMARKIEEGATDEKKTTLAYEKYNILQWMKESAPSSKLMDAPLKKIREDYAYFKRREHPDLDHYVGKATLLRTESPKTGDELRAKSLPELAKYLHEFKTDQRDVYGDKRRALLENFSRLVTSSFEESIKLTAPLLKIKNLKGDVWFHLIKGWEQATLSEAEWFKVIELLSDHGEINRETRAVCDLLESTVKKEDAVSDSVISKLEVLSDIVWDNLNELPVSVKDYGNSWLTTAINHGSGKLCEFWILGVDRRKERAGEKWNGIPSEYKDRFNKVMTGESFSAQLAWSVLASRLHYWDFVDHNWTEEKILPLFDFDHDESKAIQAWDGYLAWGRIPVGLIDQFKPLILQATKKLKDSENRPREQLFQHVIDIVFRDPGDPVDLTWLYSVLKSEETTDDDRQEIANRIWHTLREAQDEFRASLWSRWLKQFWTDRIENIPVPLSVYEVDRFISWTPWLGPEFGEAVDLVCQTRGFNLKQTHLYTDLEKSDLPEKNSKDVQRLLVHVLQDSGDSTLHGYTLKPLYDRLKKNLEELELEPLTNVLKKLGVI